MKKIAFILSLLFTLTAYSQVRTDLIGSDSTGKIKYHVIVPTNSIVFNLGYYIPVVTKNNPSLELDWNKKVGTGINFSVDFRRQFRKKIIEDEEIIAVPSLFGIGIGLGISHLQKKIEFNKHSEDSTYMDKDDDNCRVLLNCKDVSETVSITYLDIPVYLEIGRPSKVKISAFCKIGFKASVRIAKKLEYEGTYTTKGHYTSIGGESCDVTIHGVDVLGYYTDKQLEQEYASLTPIVLWGTISGGVNFPFSSLEKNRLSKWILRVSARIDYTLTPVSKAMDDPNFKGIFKFRLNQSNMLGGNGRIFAPSLEIGLIYCL